MSSAAGSGGVTNGLVLDLDGSYIGLTATVDVLLVAGGGGGGMDMGGGGGAGGVLYTTSSVAHGNTYAVVVGAGGYGGPAGSGGYRTDGVGPQPGGHQYTVSATNGGNSSFNGIIATGGGYGGSSYFGYTPNYGYGNTGGSGGGASGYSDGNTGRGGAGVSGQGNNGGNAGGQYYSGGGGGAGGVGTSGTARANGGPGILYPTMSPYYFGGGGGGAAYSLSTGGGGGIGGGGGGAIGQNGVVGGIGGLGGGGGLNAGISGTQGPNGAQANVPGGNAGANTGGGGGGGSHYNANNKGGEGGSGIVIIRYLGRQRATGGVVSSLNGYTIHTFLTNGTFDTTAWIDKSGSGNNVTLLNGPTYSSANGGGVVFDGTNDYLTISTFSNKPTAAITCEAWIKPTKSVLTGTIRGGAISANNSMYLGIIDSIDGGVTHALHWANQTSVNRINSWHGNVPNNAWSHITGTYDGATMKAYINGVEVYSASQTGTIPDANYVIGTYGNALQDGVHNFNGSIAMSKIYNRGLSASEVKQNFNATRSRYGL